MQHEATTSKVSEEQIFYLRQRGLGESQSMSLLINGFLSGLVDEFPMEYGVELKRLIEMEMDKSVG
jgi:Fe-S cluster assembly protein SufB